VSKLCTQCGAQLSKEEARFCNKCGALVSTQPHNPGPAITPQNTSTPPSVQHERRRPFMKEQVAQLPPSRPLQRSTQDQQKQFRDAIPTRRSKIPSEAIDQIPELPTATLSAAQGAQKPAVKELKDQNTPANSILPASIQHSSTPVRELRVKTWEQEGPEISTSSREEPISSAEDDVEDLSTIPLVADAPELLIHRSSPPPPTPRLQDVHLVEVEQLGTTPLSTPLQAKPLSPSLQEPGRQQQLPMQLQGRPMSSAALQRTPMPRPPMQPLQERSHRPSAPPSQERRQPPMPVSAIAVSILARPRFRLVLVMMLLLVLVLGGTGAWIIAFQPFTAAPITQPWQSFCDPGLNISTQYPTGWLKQVEQHKAVHFSDSNYGEQFSVSTVANSGEDPGKYLQKTAAQLAMTSLQTDPPLTFAGTSWQQIQGSVVLNGANYTEVLLATTHNGILVTITQLAHQSIYATVESTIFSHMRSSFQFSATCP
jgi:zinc-ribbon domain